MGKRRKTLQELTFKDNFMFAAVMLDEENAKGVVERALGIQIDHVNAFGQQLFIRLIRLYRHRQQHLEEQHHHHD